MKSLFAPMLVPAIVVSIMFSSIGPGDAAVLAAVQPTSSAATTGVDCLCSTIGPYVDPDGGGEVPSVGVAGLSPSGKFTVSASLAGSSVNLSIVRTGTTTPIFQTSIPSTAAWGFSPDDDRFVYHYVTGTPPSQVDNVVLRDLVANRQVWTTAVTTASSRINFSPHGKYLFYAAITAAQHAQLTIVDAVAGAPVSHFTEFTFSVVPGSGEDSFGVADWGWSPDAADRTFVYAWLSSSSSVQWSVVNLATKTVVHNELILSISAFWQFSPCGDVIGIVTQPFTTQVETRLFSTSAVGPPIVGSDQTFSLAPVTLRTTASSNIANVGGTDHILAANTASAACVTVTLVDLSIGPTSVAGGASATGVVTLSGPAPAGGVAVALSSDNGAATVAASLSVTSGATTATFPIATTSVGATQIVTITAATGVVTLTATLTINPVTLSSVSVSPSTVTSGTTAQGTVRLSGPAPATGLAVALSSDNAAATVAPSVTVPSGASSTTFAIATLVTGDTRQTVTITASRGGVSRTATLTVNPVAMVRTLTLDWPRVLGGNTRTATVALEAAAPVDGARVTLSSTNPAVASVPQSVLVPAGATTATFTISTFSVQQATPVTISAARGVTKLAALRVLAPPSYTVTPLGGADGGAVAINSAGQVVGAAQFGGESHAFLWMPTSPNGVTGAITDLGTLGGTASVANAINDGGQVAGTSDLPPAVGGVVPQRAFLWNPSSANGTAGSLIDLGTLDPQRDSAAFGINAQGAVVGDIGVCCNSRAFLWTPAQPNGSSGAMTDLGNLPDNFGAAARAINADGDVVGSASGPSTGARPQAFMWSGGTMGFLGPGGSFSWAIAITDDGDVAGYDDHHGWVIRDGVLTSLATLGGAFSRGLAVNAAGDVVGDSTIDQSGVFHGFVAKRIDAAMRDLDDLVPADWDIAQARGINAIGQIVGTGRSKSDPLLFQPLLLTPIAPAKAATSTTLTLPANPPVAGQPVTLTAMVAALPPATATPTGTVTFKEGSSVLGSGTLIAGSATLTTTSLSAGSHAITAEYAGDAAFAPSSSLAATLTVLPAPALNTPTGNNVQVVVLNVPGDATATVTFAQVSVAGNTLLNTSATGSPPPAGFSLGDPPTYFDVSTTAGFTPPVGVCLDITGVTFVGQPRIFHLENATWVDRTTSFDAIAHVICGTVSSLSPFVVAFDSAPPVTTASLAPTPNAAGWNRGPVTVTLTAVDSPPEGAGVKEIVVTLTGATATTRTVAGDRATLTISAEGTTTVTYFARDNNGNAETSRTLAVRIDTTPPEARLRFDPMTKDLAVFGLDGLSGIAKNPIAPTSATPTGPDAERERRAYSVADRAGNTVELVVEVKLAGHELKAQVTNLRYNDVPTEALAKNGIAAEWALLKDGGIRELEQKIEVGKGKDRRELEATFNVEDALTTIKIEDPEPEGKIEVDGLALLDVTTERGRLVPGFDLPEPAAAASLSRLM